MDNAVWRRVTIASFFARLPLSMSILAMQLAARRIGEPVGAGALLTGTIAVTAGVLGRRRGRRLDRDEMRRGLQRSCGRAGAILLLLAVAVWRRAPIGVLLALCGAEGAAVAGVYGGFRALLWLAAPGRNLARPQVLETLMTELGYALGPLVVLALDETVGPVAVFVLMAALPFVAILVMDGLPGLPPTPSSTHELGSQLRAVLVFAALVGASFSMVENTVPARMASLGLSTATAGGFLALLSLGSCVGGLLASLRPPGRNGFAATASPPRPRC